MSRQLHLNVNILNAGVFGGSWRFPDTDALASYTIDHYTSIAKKAEAAKLDAVFSPTVHRWTRVSGTDPATTWSRQRCWRVWPHRPTRSD